MKTLNPFIPTVALISVPSRDRRQRFKRTFLTVLAAHAILLLGLLMSDHNRDLVVSAKELPAGSAPLDGQSIAMATSPAPKPAPAPQAAAVAAPKPAPVAPAAPVAAKVQVTPLPSRPEALYAVKSGDTLNDIARKYATTPKAIRAANGLATEHLSVNQKLKIP